MKLSSILLTSVAVTTSVVSSTIEFRILTKRDQIEHEATRIFFFFYLEHIKVFIL